MSKISDYTAATAVTDDDHLLGNDGSTTKKFPATLLKTYLNSGFTLNTRTGSYTLVLGDADGFTTVEMNVATANNLTVPPFTSVAFPDGSCIYIRQIGAGQTTIVEGAGVDVVSRGDAMKFAGQWAEATLTKRATDQWVLSGDITT